MNPIHCRILVPGNTQFNWVDHNKCKVIKTQSRDHLLKSQPYTGTLIRECSLIYPVLGYVGGPKKAPKIRRYREGQAR